MNYCIQKMEKTNILLFEGSFNVRIISSFVQYIHESIVTSYEMRICIQRVLIEMCQNVAFYSSKRAYFENTKPTGIGSFKFSEENDHYICSTSNQIKPSDSQILSMNCETINNLTLDQLFKLREELRRKSSIRDNSAHIGLISLKLYSKNQLNYTFETITNNQEIFSITTIINKK